ncbi:hypothetical protein [Pelagibius sp.]|uniref:hypothetical protein n=1 Tax=Pelagibius sp. TaxID=1931238 RepID=UPI00261FD08D|nr:hypothetical protein [Pelagibius sp.]
MNHTEPAIAVTPRRQLGTAAGALSSRIRTMARNRASVASIGLSAPLRNALARLYRRGAEVALAGMPPRRIRTTISLAGRCPAVLFYLPVLLHCLRLAWRHRGFTLPSVANPNIECGGFRGESKMSYLDQIPDDLQGWVAPSLRFVLRADADRRQDLRVLQESLKRAGLCFPLVAKPDIGSQGYGVRLVATPGALAGYLARFPRGEAVILQRYIDWQGEAGVFYIRRPDEPRGRIFSLGFRCFPHVVGDGRSTLGALIDTDPRTRRMARRHRKAFLPHLAKVPPAGEMVRLSLLGSVRTGAFYYDGQDYVTPALTARIDEISRRMPAFHFGRFDVRFESVEALRRGEGFQIMEVNGASAEALHIWDPDQSLTETYRVLFDQFRLLYEIGACNRDRGHRPIGLAAFLALQWRESSLLRRYPASG